MTLYSEHYVVALCWFDEVSRFLNSYTAPALLSSQILRLMPGKCADSHIFGSGRMNTSWYEPIADKTNKNWFPFTKLLVKQPYCGCYSLPIFIICRCQTRCHYSCCVRHSWGDRMPRTVSCIECIQIQSIPKQFNLCVFCAPKSILCSVVWTMLMLKP